MKHRGLGRGLDALLAGDEVAAPKETLRDLPLGQIKPGKYQPRTRMDQDSLQELAASIQAQGIMQPILVRPIGKEQYEIIAGERRWRAAQMAGMKQVPALIREVPDEAALAMGLIENIQRENLNSLEEAAGLQRLIKEFNMTHQTAADAIGRSRSAATNLLRLLNLSKEVQTLLHQGRLDMGHARALLALNESQQISVANKVIAKNCSVREAEQLVHDLLHPKASVSKIPRQVQSDRDIQRLEEDIAERIGTRIEIKRGKKGAGKLIISYTNSQHLDSILGRIK